MASMKLFSCCLYLLLHRPAQARHYPADLKMNYIPDIFFESSSSYSFIPSLSSSNEHHMKFISFQGITFICIGRCLGFVISTLLLHPNILVSLQCSTTLSFFTHHFLQLQAYFWLSSFVPADPSQSCSALLLLRNRWLCVTQSWHLHLHSFYSKLYNICRYCILIEGDCSLLKPSSQSLCI